MKKGRYHMNYTIRFPIILNELTDVRNNQLRDHIMFGKNFIYSVSAEILLQVMRILS